MAGGGVDLSFLERVVAVCVALHAVVAAAAAAAAATLHHHTLLRAPFPLLHGTPCHFITDDLISILMHSIFTDR